MSVALDRSVGCILAELLQRKPLFPGKDYIDQLKLIIKTLGSPSDTDLSFINSQKAQQYIKALPKAQVCQHAYVVNTLHALCNPNFSCVLVAWRVDCDVLQAIVATGLGFC